MISATETDGRQLREFVESVVRSHGPGWVRYVRRVVRNEADAEDAVQEAVRRVLARNRQFSSSEDVRMYLGRAVSNAAIMIYNERQRSRERMRPIRDGTIPDGGGANPQEIMEAREAATERRRLMVILSDALARLPSKQYEAVRMTLLEPGEASIRDAGAASGIPYSTLRHRTVQGLRRLRRYANRAMRRAGLRSHKAALRQARGSPPASVPGR
jgi:RNA polymerase sigma factor (sigma-70 family)